jgi:MoaA/NifB/PqqE/SkfB family radical SAM enzyme
MAAVGGAVSVNVTGGEPLLYQCHHTNNHYGRDVFELMSHLSTFDNLGELNIITSTYRMDDLVIDGLLAVSKLTSVKVSLESHDQLINDRIRGSGHFEMVARNIRRLAQAGLRVIVMATLGKYNYRSVKGLCALAAELGAGGVMFERFVPLGRGAGLEDSVLTSREWTDVLRAICQVADMDADTSINDLLPYKAFLIDMPRGATGEECSVSGAPCCLGPSSMALMPDGTVYPCRRVPVAVGKLPDDGMERIFNLLDGYSSVQQRCFEFDF